MGSTKKDAKGESLTPQAEAAKSAGASEEGAQAHVDQEALNTENRLAGFEDQEATDTQSRAAAGDADGETAEVGEIEDSAEQARKLPAAGPDYNPAPRAAFGAQFEAIEVVEETDEGSPNKIAPKASGAQFDVNASTYPGREEDLQATGGRLATIVDQVRRARANGTRMPADAAGLVIDGEAVSDEEMAR